MHKVLPATIPKPMPSSRSGITIPQLLDLWSSIHVGYFHTHRSLYSTIPGIVKEMSDKYILVDGEPVLEPNLYKWGEWLETSDRRIARTVIDASTFVSTVFLGLDHQYGHGPPLLFETMVFTDGKGGACRRCSTLREAQLQHAEMCNEVIQTKES